MLSLLPMLAPLIHFNFTTAIVLRHSALLASHTTEASLVTPSRKRSHDGSLATVNHSWHTTTANTFTTQHWHQQHQRQQLTHHSTGNQHYHHLPTAIANPHQVLLLGADTAGETNQNTSATPPTPVDTNLRGTITTPKKVYHSPLASLYQPPELGSDLLEGTDWLFRKHGQAICETTAPLTPRDDVISFDPGNNQAKLDRNFQPQHCPLHLQTQVSDTIKAFWDVFCERGLRHPNRGFSFQIDTGTSPPPSAVPPHATAHMKPKSSTNW